jgi:hypothetical protein
MFGEKKEEIESILKKNIKARGNADLFRKIAANFRANEETFLNLDEEDKEAYIRSNYDVSTKRAYDSLSPQLKELYEDMIAASPQRSYTNLENLLKDGVPMDRLPAKYISGVSRNPDYAKRFLRIALGGENVDWENVPQNLLVLAIGTDNDEASGDPELASLYIKWLIEDKHQTIDQIPERLFGVVYRTTKFVRPILKLIQKHNQGDLLMNHHSPNGKSPLDKFRGMWEMYMELS